LHTPPRSTTSTLSLHDALPISLALRLRQHRLQDEVLLERQPALAVDVADGGPDLGVGQRLDVFEQEVHEPALALEQGQQPQGRPDRKSTRLNSSHLGISYAVFC